MSDFEFAKTVCHYCWFERWMRHEKEWLKIEKDLPQKEWMPNHFTLDHKAREQALFEFNQKIDRDDPLPEIPCVFYNDETGRAVCLHHLKEAVTYLEEHSQ